jgi:hypothetical protein
MGEIMICSREGLVKCDGSQSEKSLNI